MHYLFTSAERNAKCLSKTSSSLGPIVSLDSLISQFLLTHAHPKNESRSFHLQKIFFQLINPTKAILYVAFS